MSAIHPTPEVAAAKAAVDATNAAADAIRDLAAMLDPRCACGQPLPFSFSQRCETCAMRRSVARAALRRMRDDATVALARLGDEEAQAEIDAENEIGGES